IDDLRLAHALARESVVAQHGEAERRAVTALDAEQSVARDLLPSCEAGRIAVARAGRDLGTEVLQLAHRLPELPGLPALCPHLLGELVQRIAVEAAAVEGVVHLLLRIPDPDPQVVDPALQ